MAQKQSSFVMSPHCIYCSNVDLFVYSGYESIVLDNIDISAITNFAIEVKNKSNSGSVTDVIVYGSPNQVDYFVFQNNLWPGGIPPNTIKHVEFTGITRFLRVNVRTDANINIDVHLHGNLT